MFATAVNCIDGRVQAPVTGYIKKKFGAKYVDMITLPGPNKVLSDNTDRSAVRSIKESINISINSHGSKLVAVTGHYDCAGNPVDKEEQINHITDAVREIRTWDINAHVIGLWVDQDWEVEELIL
jgi:carbonic anhydrase